MANAPTKKTAESVANFADMFSAMGVEPILRIMQLLLSAHPDGLVVGEIQEELEIPNSTLSHHLDKLRNEGLVRVQRESTFLRYTADTEALQQLLGFQLAARADWRGLGTICGVCGLHSAKCPCWDSAHRMKSGNAVSALKSDAKFKWWLTGYLRKNRQNP